MKYLLLNIFLLAMFACNPDGTIGIATASTDSSIVKLKTNYDSFKQFTVITIDGCEYLVYKNNDALFIEHKGNCKNPIHYQVKHDTIYVVRETGMVLQKQVKK